MNCKNQTTHLVLAECWSPLKVLLYQKVAYFPVEKLVKNLTSYRYKCLPFTDIRLLLLHIFSNLDPAPENTYVYTELYVCK